MVDRIVELLKEKNLSPSQFADEVGIQRSGMSHLLSGRNKPSLELIMKILRRYPNVKADWLLHGTGSPGEDLESPVRHDAEVKEGTLFDLPVITEKRSENKQPTVSGKTRKEKKIEKIVVFYDDKSFREYEPEQ